MSISIKKIDGYIYGEIEEYFSTSYNVNIRNNSRKTDSLLLCQRYYTKLWGFKIYKYILFIKSWNGFSTSYHNLTFFFSFISWNN